MQASEPRFPTTEGHGRGPDRRLDDSDPGAGGQRLDRELDEALALAGPCPREGEALAFLDGLDRTGALVAALADGDLAALDRVEFDLGSQPLRQTIVVGEGLPDLLRASLHLG